MQKHRARALAAAAVLAATLTAATLTGASAANAGTLPACTGSEAHQQLTATIYKTDAGAGQRQIDYKLTNTSTEPCLVEGAPSSAALGTPEGWVAITTGSTYFTPNTPATWIRLDPGQSAYGEIAYTATGPTFTAPNFSPNWDTTKLGVDLGAVQIPQHPASFTATNLHLQPVTS